jgi:PhzF family phenazine biosynthesis protein
MKVQKLASFTCGGQGGNPAGVVITDTLPDAAIMQAVAAEVGYSETAFAAPEGEGFRVRYFAPQAEVPFCGHATIALGAVLGAAFGEKRYQLILNDAQISVDAYQDDARWGAKFVSPRTSYAAADPVMLAEFLGIFDLKTSDLEQGLAPALANCGAKHLVLPLARHDLLHDMAYDFDDGAACMQKHALGTINLIWRDGTGRIYSRNAFAGHGVYEDPATGAAAAALAGYLRDSGVTSAPFEVVQGVEMGAPSRLWVAAQAGAGAPVEVSGTTRSLD